MRGRVLDLRTTRASGGWFVTLRRLYFLFELEPLSAFYWFNQEDWIG